MQRKLPKGPAVRLDPHQLRGCWQTAQDRRNSSGAHSEYGFVSTLAELDKKTQLQACAFLSRNFNMLGSGGMVSVTVILTPVWNAFLGLVAVPKGALDRGSFQRSVCRPLIKTMEHRWVPQMVHRTFLRSALRPPGSPYAERDRQRDPAVKDHRSPAYSRAWRWATSSSVPTDS